MRNAAEKMAIADEELVGAAAGQCNVDSELLQASSEMQMHAKLFNDAAISDLAAGNSGSGRRGRRYH